MDLPTYPQQEFIEESLLSTLSTLEDTFILNGRLYTMDKSLTFNSQYIVEILLAFDITLKLHDIQFLSISPIPSQTNWVIHRILM